MNVVNKILRGDKVIWIVALILGIISVIVVYSATSVLVVSKYEGNTGRMMMKHVGMLLLAPRRSITSATRRLLCC